MEYIFDTSKGAKLYRGYELIKVDGTVYGPGEYNWVKHEGKVLLDKSSQLIPLKKKCIFDCTDKILDANEEDQLEEEAQNYNEKLRKEAAARQIDFGQCCTKNPGEKETKDFVNDLPLDTP
jgi:hypothetical protein